MVYIKEYILAAEPVEINLNLVVVMVKILKEKKLIKSKILYTITLHGHKFLCICMLAKPELCELTKDTEQK